MKPGTSPRSLLTRTSKLLRCPDVPRLTTDFVFRLCRVLSRATPTTRTEGVYNGSHSPPRWELGVEHTMNIRACLAGRYATHVFISTAARDNPQFDERDAQRALIPPLVYVEQDVDVCSLPMRRPRTPGMKARGENSVCGIEEGRGSVRQFSSTYLGHPTSTNITSQLRRVVERRGPPARVSQAHNPPPINHRG